MGMVEPPPDGFGGDVFQGVGVGLGKPLPGSLFGKVLVQGAEEQIA